MTTKNQLLKMVRQNCSECMGGPRGSEDVWPVENTGDIEGCSAKLCLWFEFRFGNDPYPNPNKVRLGRKFGFKTKQGIEQNDKNSQPQG